MTKLPDSPVYTVSTKKPVDFFYNNFGKFNL